MKIGMIMPAPAKLGAPYSSLVLRVNGSLAVCALLAVPPPAIFASAESIKTSRPRIASPIVMLDYLAPQWEQRNAVNPLHRCYTRRANPTSQTNLRAKRRPRHFAISSHWVQGSPLPKEVRNPRGGAL